MFRKMIAALLIVTSTGVFLSQCIGQFSLTRKVHAFNMGIGNRWIRWLIFLVLVIIPVYGICILVDALVINSIEFWTGSNPVAYDSNGEHIDMQEKGAERIVYHHRKFGAEMTIHVFVGNELKKAFLLKKDEPGVMYALKGDGIERIEMKVREGDEVVSIEVTEGNKVIHTEKMTRLTYISRISETDRIAAKAGAAVNQF